MFWGEMMATTIYKYYIPIQAGLIRIKVPGFFKICDIKSVDSVDDGIYMWAFVDTDSAEREICFLIYATGEPIQDDPNLIKTYLRTLVMPNGLVWHVFIVEENLNI